MNWSAGKVGTINQRPARANGLSTPAIGCVLDLPALPGGGSKIYDRSPYGNIGTITGATWVRLPSGLWCLSFDGSDDHVGIPNSASLDIANAITLMVWVRSSVNSNCRMLWKQNYGNAGYGLWSTADVSFDTGHAVGGRDMLASGVNTADDVWHLITGTYDVDAGTNNKKVFIDGVQKNQKTLTEAIGSYASSLYIGAASPSVTVLTGYIAPPRIHNRALSALEIQNSFNREKHLFGVW